MNLSQRNSVNQLLKRAVNKLIGNWGKKLILRVLLEDEEKVLLDFRRAGYFVETGWLRSLKRGLPTDINGQELPWFTYPAIRFLQSRLSANHRIYEYGSGASTIFFQKTGALTYSVEYDPQWYDRLKPRVIPPNTLFFNSLEVNKGDDYINSIMATGLKFDLLVLDGRRRVDCCKVAIQYLDDYGIVILDDSERPQYLECYTLLKKKGFNQIEFWGISPGDYNLKCTTVFYRSSNNFEI